MHANEQVLRDGYTAFEHIDLETLTRDMTDDCVWHIRGSVPGITRDRWGREDILDFIGQFLHLLDGDFQINVLSVFADDHHGVVLCMVEGSSAGESIDSLAAHVFRFRDGKICEGWFLFDRAIEIHDALLGAFEQLTVSG